MARSHGDAVDEELAQLGDNARREILGAGRGAGVDDHQVMRLRRLQDAVADGGVVVGQRRQAGCAAAPLRDHRAQHQRVILDDIAGAEIAPRRHELGAGGLDGDARPAPHAQPGVTRAGRRADVLRSQPVIRRQDQLCGDHVLAHRAHVLPRRNGGQNLDCGLRTANAAIARDSADSLICYP